MSPFMQNFPQWQIYKDKKLVSGFLDWKWKKESDGKWE